MPEKLDYIENPIDGRPLLREPLKISGIIFIILVLYLIQYYKDTTDNKYVREHDWKCGGNCIAGDWLSFKTKYWIVRNDTIFKQDTAVAVIVNIDKALFGDNELKIQSVKTGELDTYHEK